jgi:zinc and cadmium transporter
MGTQVVAILAASAGVMVVSLSGVLFVFKRINKWTERNIKYLVAFSAGVFLIISYNLVFEAIEFSSNNIIATISILGGFLMFYLLEKLYPESHCHHDDKKCIANADKSGAHRVMIGDAFHNIADGILLVPAFLVDIKLGIAATVGILIHELIQEISEFFVLKDAGYTTKQSLIRNFLISSTILIGAGLGLYVSSVGNFIGPFLGVAAGAFIYIVLVDLIPNSVKASHKEKKYLKYLFWVVFGVVLILGVNQFSGEGHGEEDDHAEEVEHLIG